MKINLMSRPLIFRLKSIIFLLLCSIGYSNSFASTIIKEWNEERYLVEILDEIGEKYKVFFNYESDLVSEIKLYFELSKEESLNEVVDRLMEATNLKYELTSDKFIIIYKNDKQGKKESKKGQTQNTAT